MLDEPAPAPLAGASPDHVLVDLDGLSARVGAELPGRFDPPIDGLRGTFGRLLGLLPAEGARPTELAAAAGVTKQAIGQHVADLEARGWVRTGPDPADGRGRIVVRTPAGDDVRDAVERAIASVEAGWAQQVGAERYRLFREVLAELAVDHRPTTAVSRRA